MLPDLKFLIRLQELDSAAERLRRRMADLPAAQAALETRLANLTAAVAGVKERIAASQTSRRDTEKDLAAVQARLSKYKDQLMEVKTNKEYHAMQTEITAAETLVRREEDRLLERMEEAELFAAELKAAEAALKSGQS
jgi:predicted  nucleic acid-binding Zn-ribbon protein